MSKKKRDRKENAQLADSFTDAMIEAQLAAYDFIETATPLEISTALTELGVTTSHRAGVEEFLRSWRLDPNDPTLETPFEALAVRWLWEIEQKRGPNTIDLEDDVLLVELARFFWLRINSDRLQAPA